MKFCALHALEVYKVLIVEATRRCENLFHDLVNAS